MKPLFLNSMLACVDAYFPSVITGRLKFNHTINKSEKGMISADTHVVAGMNFRAPLPNQNSPGKHLLTGVSFHAEPFRLTITTTAAATTRLLMRHLLPPLS